MAVLNGRLPLTMLGTIPGTSRKVLLELVPQVAALRTAFWERFGKALVITDAYRDYDAQVRVKEEKGFLAGTPGTSVHGWGRALDLGSGVNSFSTAEYRWMKDNAGRFGLYHPAWAEPTGFKPEPWHWEILATPIDLNAPQEDDMSALAESQIAEIHAAIGAGNAAGLAETATVLGLLRANVVGLPAALQEILGNVAGVPDVLAQIRVAAEGAKANTDGVPDVLARIEGDLQKVEESTTQLEKSLSELHGIVWAGTEGTPWKDTIYQMLTRVHTALAPKAQ